MFKAVLCILSCSVVSLGFLYEDPCYVSPDIYGIPDNTSVAVNVTVPENCRNGTFHWDYPVGRVLLKFSSTQTVQSSVCFKDSLGGYTFSFTDIASNLKLGKFNHTQWACTKPNYASEIVLRVDAPLEMHYMGAVLYKLET